MADVFIKIETGLLELDIDYKIESEQTKIEFFGIVSSVYWNPHFTLDDRITADQIRDLMDAINRSMFNQNFTMQVLIQIPPLLQQHQRNDLAAVAMDWLSQYHMNPPKNQMRL